jgi:hypothetical protein
MNPKDWGQTFNLYRIIRKPHECLIRVTGSHELIFSGLSGRRKSTDTSAVLSYTTTHPKISSFNALLRQNSWYLCMAFDCSAVSRAPEFRSECRDVTNNEWHTTNDVMSCNTYRRRQRSAVAPSSCIVMTSGNSGPNSGALETAAQQWVLSPDQHFVWSDIFITRQIGILGRAIFLSCIFAYFSWKHPWLKALETSFPHKGIPWRHSAWFWKGLHVYFLQIVVFIWWINACRVYDKPQNGTSSFPTMAFVGSSKQNRQWVHGLCTTDSNLKLLHNSNCIHKNKWTWKCQELPYSSFMCWSLQWCYHF